LAAAIDTVIRPDLLRGQRHGGVNMSFTFNFADGFQGTTEFNKQNFVMVYAVP
jgi:hypothetical protein